MLGSLGDERDLRLLAEVADSEEQELAPRAPDLLGDARAAVGDWTRAEAAYQRAMESGHPHWSSVARLDLAMMLADRNELARAENLFRAEAASSSALTDVAEAFLGTLLVQQGHMTERRPLLDRLVGSDSDTAAGLARLQLGKLAAEEGQLNEAAALFEALLDSQSEIALSTVPLAQAHLGAILLRRGEVDRALRLLDDASASGHTDAAAMTLVDRGEYLIEVGDTAVAQEYLRAALDTEEPDVVPKTLALLGVALLAEGDLEGARIALTDSLDTRTPPVEPLTRRYLGSALARLGRRTEARKVLLPLARSQDAVHRPQGLVVLGQLAMLDGHAVDAHDWFIQAMESDDPEAQDLARRALTDAGTPPRPSLAPGPPAPDPELTAAPQPSGPAEAPKQPVSLSRPTVASDAAAVPSDLLLVLGRIAEAEGCPDEARYWFERALADGRRSKRPGHCSRRSWATTRSLNGRQRDLGWRARYWGTGPAPPKTETQVRNVVADESGAHAHLTAWCTCLVCGGSPRPWPAGGQR